MIVWLASYPRSGNTYLRILIHALLRHPTYSVYDDPFDIAAHAATRAATGHEELPADFDWDRARDDSRLWFIKTHEKVESRLQRDDRILYLARDGRAAITSQQSYLLEHGRDVMTIAELVTGCAPFGAWAEHLRSWQPLVHDRGRLIRFEELTTKPIAIMEEVAGDLGIALHRAEVPDFEQLQRMNPAFFRAGRSDPDAWTEAFDDPTHLLFWLLSHTEMNELGYDRRRPAAIEQMDHIDVLSAALQAVRTPLQHLRSQAEATEARRAREALDHVLPRLMQRMDERNDILVARLGARIDRMAERLEESQRNNEALYERLQERNREVQRLDAVRETAQKLAACRAFLARPKFRTLLAQLRSEVEWSSSSTEARTKPQS